MARTAILMSATLATAALVLTLDELSRPRPVYFSWPDAPELDAITLLALVGATGWLVRATRTHASANTWAKSALALAASLPFGWIVSTEIVRRKLIGLPDADLPESLADRMVADVVQMQVAALLVTVATLACIAFAAQAQRA
jgi:hypothetical protein